MKVSVIIPTLNAIRDIQALMDALCAQTPPLHEIIVVDSQSADGTADAAQKAGAKVIRIVRSEFDHGGTRDMALRASSGDAVVFMTQDAMPRDQYAIANLVAPLADPQIGAVGGRQIAKGGARPFERLVRSHNYPEQSRTWGAEDVDAMGVRAYTISDVFAAYRREAYLAVGGFDQPVMTNEDMLMVQKLLKEGYRIAYAGDACVLHSHNLTLRQQYRRNYLIGRIMKRYEGRFGNVQEVEVGAKMAATVFAKLIKGGQLGEAACFVADCAARLLGNRMGRHAEYCENSRNRRMGA